MAKVGLEEFSRIVEIKLRGMDITNENLAPLLYSTRLGIDAP